MIGPLLKCIMVFAATLAAGAAHAATILFDTDPFAGSTALTTPGRQIVGGETFVTFDPATDKFAFDAGAFGVSGLDFFIGEAAGLPASGVNLIVLLTTDNDGDSATPFGAGAAANLIADKLSFDTPGFFIYFNSGLDLPRLVFSTNLADAGADLKILARLTNLTGPGGVAALSRFTADNFELVDTPPIPIPPAMALFAAPLLIAGARGMFRARSAATT